MADVYSHEVFFMEPYCMASYDLGICMKSINLIKKFQSSEWSEWNERMNVDWKDTKCLIIET